MRTRRLALRRESLAALASDELALVAGGAHTVPDPQCVLDRLPPVIIEIEYSRVLPCETSPCTS